MEPQNQRLDAYILKQSPKRSPKVCFIGTASGDAKGYIQRFYKRFENFDCKPTHLSLFKPNFSDLKSFVLDQDILYVGGGNTRNLLVLWKEWGLDQIIKTAYEKGTILSGLSAGSICWFEQGLSDSVCTGMHPINGLGIIPGSHAPHYSSEKERGIRFHQCIHSGSLKSGYGIDDSAAIHFIDGNTPYRCCLSRQSQSLFRRETE